MNKSVLKAIGIVVCFAVLSCSVDLLSYPDDLVVGIGVFGLCLSLWCIALLILPTIKRTINNLKTNKNVQRNTRKKSN